MVDLDGPDLPRSEEHLLSQSDHSSADGDERVVHRVAGSVRGFSSCMTIALLMTASLPV